MTVLALDPFQPPQFWYWQGHAIAYQACGDSGPAVVLVHGFGASWGHWRKNLPILGQTCRCYALDLIGFGDSAKPLPKSEIDYTFETWATLVADFCREVVQGPAFLVGNSIGCVVVMQCAVDFPEQVLGIAALNCSLRLLHERKRSALPWYRRVGARLLQALLQNPAVGQFFFRQVAQAKTVRQALHQAYARPEAVTEELVEMLLKPARDPGAAAVFLAFTNYSQGPLPEDLLPQLTCPTLILWGAEDPWEPLSLGQALADYPAVEQFIPLPGLGHCPQDEGPEIVNPILQAWIQEKASQSSPPSPLGAHLPVD
ncbi:alpha/beta fold hydrolase [Synechocystis sp. LKSZ1]|uniref:alpha/beta fold hydrolase n=1 Tax=Synechocystis sp. LKSZ1 TaxID=3144951 RepID=UPI00336BEDBA